MLRININAILLQILAVLIIVSLQSCSFPPEDFSCKEPLSWVYATSPQNEQLIKITRWDIWREQAKIDETNYLDFDFWTDYYGLHFNACPFTINNIRLLLIELNNDDEFIDVGKEQLGISFLDLQWELAIDNETTIIKVSSNANFDKLEVFLQKTGFTKLTEDGISYYHQGTRLERLKNSLRQNHQPQSAPSISKNNLYKLPNLYFNRKQGIVVVGNSSKTMLSAVKTHLSKAIPPHLATLNFQFIDQTFKDHYSLLFSNRQPSIKSHITSQKDEADIDTLCKNLLKISYKELKELNEIPLNIMGVSAAYQSAKIVAVYNDIRQPKKDQKTREFLILEAPSFLTTKAWNRSYLTYIDTEIKDNYLIYNFAPGTLCLWQAIMARDFPFLISPN